MSLNPKYLDKNGKEINVDDRIHYASRTEIFVGRVKELMPQNKGVKIIGVGKKREAILAYPDKQIIVVNKGYYKNHKKANRTGRA